MTLSVDINMWSTIWSKIMGVAISLSNPSDATSEIRLIGYGLVVVAAISWLSVDLYLKGHIIITVQQLLLTMPSHYLRHLLVVV